MLTKILLFCRAVFPYSIVVLCWHGLANRVGMLFAGSDTDSEAGRDFRGSSPSFFWGGGGCMFFYPIPFPEFPWVWFSVCPLTL